MALPERNKLIEELKGLTQDERRTIRTILGELDGDEGLTLEEIREVKGLLAKTKTKKKGNLFSFLEGED